MWFLSVSWNLKSNSTNIHSDGFTHLDLQEIDTYVSETNTAFRHPFALLAFLINLLDIYYNKMIQTLGTDIAILEKKLGITRGHKGFHGWSWKPDVFRTYTQECYRLTATPVYLERRMVFLTSLCSFMLECLHDLDQEAAHDFPGRSIVFSANVTLVEDVRNVLQLAGGQLHQVRCLEKRLQNLMSTVCSSPVGCMLREITDSVHLAQYYCRSSR